MRVSLILVHYHTPELAREAVESVRAELARPEASGLEGEVLLVDNGSDGDGREMLDALPVGLLRPEANLGYAGGINLGVSRATGDVLLLANPDVELLTGSLPTLVRAVTEGGADAAGPRFFWERGRRFLLPPTERRDRASELLARMSARRGPWAGWARRRWRHHARRHWRAEEPIPSHHLPGALLAIRRTAWETVGPFDEGYRLYFEETDWLRRLHRSGLTAVHEPRAEVVHHYNRSAAGEPMAAGWYAESARRFESRWYGPLFRAVLAVATPRRPRPVRTPVLPPGPPTLDLPESTGRLWVELSPLERGYPAAAERLPVGVARWSLPEARWRLMDPGRWRLTVVDEVGEELLVVACRRPVEREGEP